MDKVDKGVSINWQNLLSYNHVSVIVPDVDRIWFGTYFYGYGEGEYLIISPRETHHGGVSIRTKDGPRRLFPWLWMENLSGWDLKRAFPFLIKKQKHGKNFTPLKMAFLEIC
jgi:hypothetical protein